MGKKLAFSLPALEIILGAEQDAQHEEDEVYVGVEAPNSEPSSAILNAVHLAAIPKTEEQIRWMNHPWNVRRGLRRLTI
jgi:hypothetical protein